MFAKLKGGNAICLEAYNGLNEGAIVPQSNERWADVEQWISDNGPLPDYDYPPVPEKVKTQFTPGEYLDRFTEGEYDAVLDLIATSKPIRKFYDRLLASSYVDLKDPKVEMGLNALVQAGVFDEVRKDKLMEPEPIEDDIE